MGLIAGVGDFGLTELRDETLQYRNEAEVILDSIENLDNKGILNASTGVATIEGVTVTLTAIPPTGWLNGQQVEVQTVGNIGFSGINFTSGTLLNIGDKLRKRGTQWELIRFAVGDGTITPEKTTFAGYFRLGNILPYSGNLVIDTVARKISTTGRIFVAWNLDYKDTDVSNSGTVQAPTDWDSTIITGLHFIVFNITTLQFGVVRYNNASTYNNLNYVTVGLIERDSSGSNIVTNCTHNIIVDGLEIRPTYSYINNKIISDTNRYRSADLYSFNGLLVLDSNSRTVSVENGQIFLVENGRSTAIDIQESTAWDSNTSQSLCYIMYDATDAKVKVILFSRISNYNINNLTFLGIIASGNSSPANVKVECTIKGKYKLDGNIFNMGFSSINQTAKIIPFGGYLNITTSTKKYSIEGTCFVSVNGNYYTVDPQAEIDWYSQAGTGFHYIFYNQRLNNIQIIRHNNAELNSTRQDDRYLLGFIGTDSLGKVYVKVDGVYKIDGKIVNEFDFATDFANLEKFKFASVMKWAGDLVIDTANRKVSTDGQLFVNYNSEYINVTANQASTDWDSSSLSGLHYILFNTSTKLFRIVKFDAISSFNVKLHILIGFIGNDVNGRLRHYISGNYVLNNEHYPLQTKVFNRYGLQNIGALSYCGFDTDYSLLMSYSQSLPMGWEGHYALTTTNYPDTYMLGSSIWMIRGNNGSNTFTPLVGQFVDPCGESALVGMTNSFKRVFERYNRRGKENKFVTVSAGEGGRSIEQLSKECTNGSVQTSNLYHTTFLSALTRAKSTADGLGKTISCPVLFFAQGEHNYAANIANRGLTTGSNATSDKDAYKALLLTLKNNMQSDIMSILGQAEKPMFLMYQTSGNYIDIESMPISQAQLEFAEENNDVIMVNPHYGLPDYAGGHLTANGSRWWGENIAKTLHGAFNQNQKIGGIVMKNISITDERTIEIDFQVPVLPLVLDTKTTPLQTSFGFKVVNNGSEKTISNVSIIENKVILKFSTKLLTGTVNVSYAGLGRNGSGNLRDSDTWISQYTYYDDSANFPPTYNPLDANNQPLYGKNYPLWNWVYSFYKSISY